MIKLSYKAKQIFTLILKIGIVLGAFYFIYAKLSTNWEKDWLVLKMIVAKTPFYWIFLVLFLTFLNRFLEILKWQNLVKSFKNISVLESTKQVLGALTLAIFTPNGIGEYAGKALFFSKNETKKVIFLNLICNGIQLVLTVFFGLIGLFYLGYLYYGFVICCVLSIGLFLVFLFQKIKIRNFSILNFFNKLLEISKAIHFKNIFLGIFRYLTFSHQYYLLFILLGVQLPYFTLMATIACVYFLASSLPTFQFLDFAVKGSVAIFFFSKLDVNSWVVLFIATLMWLLNTVIPVVFGSFYVLKFKPK